MNNRIATYAKSIPNLGTFVLYPLDLESEGVIIHRWVNLDYAKYWGMNGNDLSQVKQAYHKLMSHHTEVFMAYLNGEPAFLVERYDPGLDEIGEHYQVQEGDCGMHILVAPVVRPLKNFSWAAFSTAMEFLFAETKIKRIVVEPDIRNEKIHRLNKRAGFVYQKQVKMSCKTAHLAFCARQDYKHAQSGQFEPIYPQQAVDHLQDGRAWRMANRRFVRKAVAEFAHELLIVPQSVGKDGLWEKYILKTPESEVQYHFLANKLQLDHWHILEESLVKKVAGSEVELNGLDFILEFKEELGIPPNILPAYLEEITSTLYGATYMYQGQSAPSADLVHTDYQTIEHSMTAGHPCFVANNGRIGFNADDYQRYAPEVGASFRLIWLAGHKDRATYSGTADCPYEDLIKQELSVAALSRFHKELTAQGVKPDDYWLFPMHPWQWFNKLAGIFSADIASQKLVCLGYGDDQYMAQQSIRTTYNISHPDKFYVKTALSILNMGFMRGLSPYYMASTPAVTEWVDEKLGTDVYLKDQGFLMLREVATLGYRNLYFEQLGKTHAYNKMLAVLWRESPSALLEPGQRLMTMASLLHIDANGRTMISELIKASGLEVRDWLRAYMQCYLKPLIHCFYQYDMVFMPHGENLILVMEGHVPVKAIMKDITEELFILSEEVDLPNEVRRIHAPTAKELRALSIFTDVFDCFFRFLSANLVSEGMCSEDLFWQEVAHAVAGYQQEWPALRSKFEEYDLFSSEFTRSCLNRLQLKNNQQMVDLTDPVGSLQFVGMLNNPIAKYRKEEKEEFQLDHV